MANVYGPTMDDVDKFRSKLRIGDTLRCPQIVADVRARGAFAEKWVNVRVVGIYPNLVQVRGSGSEFPIQTIKYSDILLDRRYTEVWEGRWAP